jgi:hypothetical protein
MEDRWARLAPLTGVVFALVVIVAFATSSGETPKADASTAKVISYFTAHRSTIETSAVLFMVAFLVLLLFAASLRSYLRRTNGAEGLGALALAGAGLMTVGALITGGVEYALAHQLHRLGPESIHTLNVLDNELAIPIVAGAFVFGLASGLAIIRGAELPTWLGWVAIVLGVIAFTPAGLASLLGFVVWSCVVAILMYLRSAPDRPVALATDAPATP